MSFFPQSLANSNSQFRFFIVSQARKTKSKILTVMEENQLNFNRPLLSVRRHSGTAVSSEAEDKRKTAKSQGNLPPLPTYKSELKSGPVRHPGTVPFIWELSPGRPKDESISIPKDYALEGPQVTPRLPPGRVSKVKKPGVDKETKDTTAAKYQNGNVTPSSRTISAVKRKIAKEETHKEQKDEKTSSEDGDERYVDARDVLSRTESAYMNCSVSGLSGMDDPQRISCGIFSTDPQTLDFMMGRFLPAAKAMASETPHNAPRKHPVDREQTPSREEPRRVIRVVTGDKQHHVQNIAEQSSEDEGMKMPAQVLIYSVRKVLGNSSFACSNTKVKHKHYETGVNKQRLTSCDQYAGQQEFDVDLKRETNHTSNRCRGQTLDGSSVNRCFHSTGISPYRRECSQSILQDGKCFLGIPEKAKSSKEATSLDKYSKGHRFPKLVCGENADVEARVGSPVVEKTLYVQTVKSSSSNSFCSDIMGEVTELIDYRRNNLDIPGRGGEMEEILSAECRFQDTEHLGNVNEMAAVQANFERQQLDISDDQNNFRGLTQEDKLTRVKLADEETTDLKLLDCKTSHTHDISHGLVHNSITMLNSNGVNKGKIYLESQRLVAFDNQGSSESDNGRLSLGPPLPKSPSESWLKRTLPTISSRNSFSLSYIGSHSYTSSPVSKTSSLDPKWETIVKTSNAHHGRSRFSEDLLTPIPEA